MSSAKRKLTYGMIASDMNDENTVQLEYAGARGKYEFNVKRSLSFDEAAEFVASIVVLCFDSDNGIYRPQALDFAIRFCTHDAYANIELPNKKNIKRAYDVIYKTDLYDMVKAAVDEEQYEALVHAAVQRIKYERDMAVSAAVVQINQLIAKMNEVMADGEQIVEQMSGEEMVQRMRELEEMLKPMTAAEAVATNSEVEDNIVRLNV